VIKLAYDPSKEIAKAKAAWEAAAAKGDKAGMAKAHADAEAARAKAGYSGGDDGSQRIPLSNSGYNPAIPGTDSDIYKNKTSKKSSNTGADSASSPSYLGHIQFYGGSPAAYAAAIKDKGWDNLSNPEDARAFARDYPQFFADDPTNALQQALKEFQSLQMPTAPVTNIEYRLPEEMSMEEALRLASEQLDPLTNLARMNTTRGFAQERANLPKYLNARGQLFGGLRAGGESELTQREAETLEKADLLAAANKSQVASAIKQSNDAQAKALADSIYQAALNNANLALSKWQSDMSAYQQNKQGALSTALALLQEERMRDAAAMASNQWQQQFDYTKDRNSILDTADPKLDPRYKDMFFESLAADIAATNRSNLGSSRSGGSGGSGGGGSKGSSSGGAEDAYTFLKNLKGQGGTYDKAMDYFYSNRTVFESEGVSESEYKNMAKSVFPEEGEGDVLSLLLGGTKKTNGPFELPTFGAGAVLREGLGWY
jgi:hypothetical protein